MIRELEPGSNLLNVLLAEGEGELKTMEAQQTELHQAHVLLERLGGRPIDKMPLPEGSRAVASYSTLTRDIRFISVDEPSQIRKIGTSIWTAKLSDILSLNPAHPEFWGKIADGEDKIERAVYYIEENREQMLREPTHTIVGIKGDDALQIMFLPVGGGFYWVDLALGNVFVFTELPPIIRKSFKRYGKECRRIGEPLFFDVDPGHFSYKQGESGRLAVEVRGDVNADPTMQIVRVKV